MASIYSTHENALNLLFSEVKATAEEQLEAFIGAPGSLALRTNETGTDFWVHRYSDAYGARRERYIGKNGEPQVVAALDELRKRIDTANATIGRVRVLARSGFATADRKTYATVAALHNHGLFRAGAFLIGSHAYGALLNNLGIKSIAYATEDIDIARAERLALPQLVPFIDLLRETGIEFLEVPALDRRAHATSFKEAGKFRLKVDLLVPSAGDDYPIVEVPELKAYAKGLPYLRYLLGESQQVPLLGPYGAVLVRVPAPERYAVHKLLVSQLRSKDVKSANDLRQAAILIEALSDRFPGSIQDALGAVPRNGVKYVRRATKALAMYLPASADAAWESLGVRK